MKPILANTLYTSAFPESDAVAQDLHWNLCEPGHGRRDREQPSVYQFLRVLTRIHYVPHGVSELYQSHLLRFRGHESHSHYPPPYRHNTRNSFANKMSFADIKTILKTLDGDNLLGVARKFKVSTKEPKPEIISRIVNYCFENQVNYQGFFKKLLNRVWVNLVERRSLTLYFFLFLS